MQNASGSFALLERIPLLSLTCSHRICLVELRRCISHQCLSGGVEPVRVGQVRDRGDEAQPGGAAEEVDGGVDVGDGAQQVNPRQVDAVYLRTVRWGKSGDITSSCKRASYSGFSSLNLPCLRLK